MEQNHKSVDL